MEIHNLMEDKVLNILNEICDEEERKAESGYCTSPQCRMDAACFVLNRIPQRYVTSGRGFAHLETDLSIDAQIHIDIVTLAHEGLRRVTTIQRSFYEKGDPEGETIDEGIYFQFPMIKGRIFNGLNFEPVIDVEVEFRCDGDIVPMVDTRWQNPYPIVNNTPGTYLFWPKPIKANTIGEEREFVFELVVHDDEFEPFLHSFTLKLNAEQIKPIKGMKSLRDYNLQDLFLLPLDDEIR
jgi:competence protein ComFB